MTALPPEVAAWLATSTGIDTDKLCTHYDAAHHHTCGATPTRQYIQGRRCHRHEPGRKKENT